MISLKNYLGNGRFDTFVIEDEFTDETLNTKVEVRPYSEGAPLDCVIFQMESEGTKDIPHLPSFSLTFDETEEFIKYLQETIKSETERKRKMED